MPKAWDVHKAELVQLYIAESRTLKNVQNLMRHRHGFKASYAAYHDLGLSCLPNTYIPMQDSRVSYED